MVQHRFPPAIGGSETHVHLLGKYLVQAGHDVTVLTTTSVGKSQKASKRLLPGEEIIDGIRVRRFDIKFGYRAFLHVPGIAATLRREVDEFDIVHAHCYNVTLTPLACQEAARSGVPIVVTAHDLAAPDRLPLLPRVLKWTYDRTLGRRLLQRASRLIALTPRQIEEYEALGAERRKVSVVPNALEISMTKLTAADARARAAAMGIGPDERVLAFVGRIEEYKGIQDAIAALPAVLARHPTTRFVVVGKDDGHRAALERLAAELGVAERVLFTGTVDEATKMAILKRAELFVFPSRLEGFGIVLAEAMAVGTLCLAYPIPAARDVLADGARGLLAAGRDDLSRAIISVLDDPPRFDAIRSAGQEYALTLAAPAVVSRLEKVYMEIAR